MKALKSERLAPIAAWSAMLLSALFNLLNYNDYPLLTPEVGLVALVLVAIAGGAGFLHRLAPRLSFAFTAALVLIGFSLNGASENLALLLGLGALGLAWFYDKVVLKVVTVAFATVALFQGGEAMLSGPVAEPEAPVAEGRSDLPPVVHILLDSHLGTEGMAADPALAQLRADAIAFWPGRGFRLYDGAYSRHSNTANSIPYALSFGEAPLATTSQRLQVIRPPKLGYFELLKQRGYTISSLHVDFIDYCRTQPIDGDCRTFRRSDLAAAAHADFSTYDRAMLIGYTLASMGRLPTAAYEGWRWAMKRITGKEPWAMINQTKLFPVSSVQAMESFTDRLSNARAGHAYFGHFLMPHDPYSFNADCTVKPRAEWQHQWGPGTMEERMSAYADQVHCTMQLIDRMVEALESSPAGKNAIVVIHGDHGARIVKRQPDRAGVDATDEDFAMTFSTLFAVRAPGIEPGLATGRAPVEQLLGTLARSEYREAPPVDPKDAEVYLAGEQWIAEERVKLPDFGTSLTGN